MEKSLVPKTKKFLFSFCKKFGCNQAEMDMLWLLLQVQKHNKKYPFKYFDKTFDEYMNGRRKKDV